MSDTIRVTLILKKETYNMLKKAAIKEERKPGNFARFIIKKYLENEDMLG
jgi:hypothetical protein